MNQDMKIVGLITMLLIIGLPIVNALTGYGIKGNKNLNPDVLADGSSSGSSSSGSSSSGDKGKSEKTVIQSNETRGPIVTKGKQQCQTYSRAIRIICNPGGNVDCVAGTGTESGEICFTPDPII